ncbi:alpha/beta hydrolase family protein [Bacillus sp. OTU530]|uniref:alpha/beta hydrolase family protein n=1 Tax=Bacillus sp. OTU530 TaxID=3043862 RepID=UPI00313F2195
MGLGFSYEKGGTVFIMHGDEDELVLYNQSELLFTALQNNGHNAIMYQLKGAGHGTDDFWQKRVLDIVRNFFDKHLK